MSLSKRKNKRKKMFRRWHQRLGLSLGLLVLILSVTGIALNHTETLKLNQIHLQWPVLLKRYNLNQSPPTHGFQAQGHWASQSYAGVYLDQKKLNAPQTALIGMVPLKDYWVLGFQNQLRLYHTTGTLIETITPPNAPNIEKITADANTLWVKTEQGLWQTNADFLTWQAKPEHKPLAWSQTPTTAYRHRSSPSAQHQFGTNPIGPTQRTSLRWRLADGSHSFWLDFLVWNRLICLFASSKHTPKMRQSIDSAASPLNALLA